ncbi:MAG: serine/threonine protein phosphatase [Gammaproteobacteria bacterium]|nr:MAG: serine/threonine protein phosphatase [Gammaproteobacteria bacterium]
MKLLLFSDVHGSPSRCRALVEQSRAVDIVIGAGDFACQGSGLEKTIGWLAEITKPFLVVSGNNETPEQLLQAIAPFAHIHLLHGQAITLSGETFYGVGGGIPITPFGDWSYDLDEAQATELLRNCPERAILITHSPPKGYVDRSSAGISLGSTAIAETLRRKRPKLHVCGHIHGSAGQTARLGDSIIINAGPFGFVHTLQ